MFKDCFGTSVEAYHDRRHSNVKTTCNNQSSKNIKYKVINASADAFE